MSGDETTTASPGPVGVMTVARTERISKQHEKSNVAGAVPKPMSREGRVGLRWMAERPIVALKPGNYGGAKEPQFEEVRKKG